jgi:transcriptional regulator with PAS, ATPase and Fis domain
MNEHKARTIQTESLTTEAILNSISDGVFTVARKWRISSFNRVAEQITGIGRDEALSRLCSEVLRSSMCGDDCPLQQTLDAGKPIIGETPGQDLNIHSVHNILDTQAILAALEGCGFNRLAAAKKLGIHKTTLFPKIKKLGIPLPELDGRSHRKQIRK